MNHMKLELRVGSVGNSNKIIFRLCLIFFQNGLVLTCINVYHTEIKTLKNLSNLFQNFNMIKTKHKHRTTYDGHYTYLE